MVTFIQENFLEQKFFEKKILVRNVPRKKIPWKKFLHGDSSYLKFLVFKITIYSPQIESPCKEVAPFTLLFKRDPTPNLVLDIFFR